MALIVSVGSDGTTADRLAAIERRQAVLVQLLVGDAKTNAAIGNGGTMSTEWAAIVAWARTSTPTLPTS